MTEWGMTPGMTPTPPEQQPIDGIVDTDAHPDIYYVNVFERFHEYGGPEEGGWYYPRGEYQKAMSFTVPGHYSPRCVNHLARVVAEALNAASVLDGIPPVESTQYHGGRYLVQTDTDEGKDWPDDRPHYQ